MPQTDFDPVEAGCLQAALDHLGYDVKVHRIGLVVDNKTSDLIDVDALLDALPNAHRLYIGLTNTRSPIFKAALYSGAKRANLCEPERVGELFDDVAHDDVDLLVDARNHAMIFAQRHRLPPPTFTTAIRDMRPTGGG